MLIGMLKTTIVSFGVGSVALKACIPQAYAVLDVVLVVGCSRSGSIVTFGHGFLIASDSLTKHPSGPAIQPAKNCQKHAHGPRKREQKAEDKRKYPNHSAQLCPSHHQPSSPSHSAS